MKRLAVLAAVLVVAACGNDADDAAMTDSAAAAAPAMAPAPAADTAIHDTSKMMMDTTKMADTAKTP